MITINSTNFSYTVQTNGRDSSTQGWPLGGASGALAPDTDFEGAPKRQLPTGQTLIGSTVVC
jgi:hypothetical protein